MGIELCETEEYERRQEVEEVDQGQGRDLNVFEGSMRGRERERERVRWSEFCRFCFGDATDG